MHTILNTVKILTITFTVVLSLNCKDDNIANIYLGLTKQNRIDESLNVNSDNKSLDITVHYSISTEPASEVNVTLKLPSGIIISKMTNNSGNAKFFFEKSITGICELYAESINNVNSSKANFEIFETFNYNLSIYIKE